MFVKELADLSILKNKVSVCICVSHFFSDIKKPTLHYCLKGSFIICFVKGYFLFRCVKAKLK